MGSRREKITFFRSVAAMFAAGVPLIKIFDFLASGGESERLSHASARIAQRLSVGWTLPAAAAPESSLFDERAVRLLEVGYRSGAMVSVLDRLAEEEEATWKLVEQIRSQLAYPLGMAALALLAVIILPPLVLHDLLLQVVALTAEPPALTRLLLTLSGGLSSPWFLGVVLLLSALLFQGLKRESTLEYLDRLAWRVPALARLWRDFIAVRFLRVLVTTYESGVPIYEALELAAGAGGSPHFRNRGTVMKSALIDGATLRESLEAGNCVPALVLHAVAAGEESGKLIHLLRSAARLLELELETRVEALVKLVEPLFLGVLGLFTAIFALGCLLPIVKLAESL